MTQRTDTAPNADQSGLLELATFGVEHEEFGVDILKVQETVRSVGIVRKPAAPQYVDDVVALHDRVVPIVDMRPRRGLLQRMSEHCTRIIVVEIDGRIAGFMVDSVAEVMRIQAATVGIRPDMAAGPGSAYPADRLLMLVDLQEVLTNDEHAAPAAH